MVQHIITIIVVLLLVAIDVYIRIQRLNFRVYNIDSKIQQLIERFDPDNKNQEFDDDQKGGSFLNQEAEYSYYQNCFSWTLRNGEWRKIPNNTLAEEDIIKLLPNDTAPALVVALRDDDTGGGQLTQSMVVGLTAQPLLIKVPSPQLAPNLQKEPSQKQSQKIYFNKGSKIEIRTSNLGSHLYSPNDASEPYEAFEKTMKEYILFKVLKTPCVQDLTEFISNMETRKAFSKNLLYFSNVQKGEQVINIFLAFSWLICLTLNVAFVSTGNIIDFFDQHAYLPLIGFTFVVSQIFSVCESWANSLMITLFNSLQFDDYNKKFSGKNYFKQLKKQRRQTGEENQGSANSIKKPLLLNTVQKKRSNQNTWRTIVSCLCRRCVTQNTNDHNTTSKRKRGRHSKKKEKEQAVHTEFVKTDDFYEIYDFQNRGFRKNWSKFWEFYRSGCTHINNIFASLSCVSVFAFVDKEGIISEMAKYVDEMAVIDKNEQKVILDLVHDTHVAHEEEIYAFENPKLYKDNIELLKVLGLAFMEARNPKESDSQRQMHEIFTKLPQSPLLNTNLLLHDNSIQESTSIGSVIKQDIGFHFHHALKQETDAHQDCVCALAKLIGHTDASFMNYDQFTSIWNITHNPQIGESSIDKDRERKKDNEDKKHRSLDGIVRSNESDSLNLSQDEKDAAVSIKSEETIKAGGKEIFVAQKQYKKMLLERMSKFGHIVQTIALDKSNNKLQSFSRGEANIIFSMCSDYWNGEKIVPIKKQIKSHIKDILFQWQASDFVAIGFSYKPVTPDVQKLIIDKKIQHVDDVSKHSKEVRETLEQFQKNQIFLGIIGVKHHKKQEANKMFRSMEDAGIRGVLFSKEGVLETKSLAKELGIDSDWNAWISLSENPSDFTKLYNEDGHLILPYGIQGIKKHIQEVDNIPLQVPMFCDSTAETTRQMFQIYQENGDVVACIGNIMNSENLHIFQQANVAVGMMIEPSYRCYRCNGRISKIQQPQGKRDIHHHSSYHNMQQYKPTKLERLSAAINSLACTFVFDANTNIYCFFSIFREARRLREGVEMAAILAMFTYFNVFLVLFLDLVLGLHHYCNQLEVLFILIVSVPIFSVSCMSRPTKNSIMKRHVLSPKYLQHLDYVIFMLKTNVFKIILATMLMYSVRLLYFSQSIIKFKELYPQEYQNAFNDKNQQSHFSDQIKYLLYGKWYELKYQYIYWQQTFELEHKFNFCFLLVILSYLCIGLESPKSTLFYKFTSNTIFRKVLLLQIVFIIAYYALSTTVFQNTHDNPGQLGGLYYPSYQIWLSAFGALLILAIVEELTKKRLRMLFKRDNNRLSIFFSTKLGMWSPR